MRRTFVLAFATVAAVASVAIAGTTAMGLGQTDSTSCTCSTVDLESGSVTLVVLANGTDAGSLSVSQQVSQTNDYVRVRIDAEHDGTSVEIAGETVENGSLVLNVTRNGEVVNENVVVDGSETGAVVFHLESDGVRVSTDEETPPECNCDDVLPDVGDAAVLNDADGSDVADIGLDAACSAISDIEVNVGEGEKVSVGDVVADTNVNAGNVSLNVPVLSSGDSSANAEQIIDDNDVFQSEQNADRGDDDANHEKC